MSVPRLSASALTQGSEEEKTKFANDLVEVLKRNSFVILTDHGLDAADIAELFQWNKRAFEVPKHLRHVNSFAKKELEDSEPRPFRGYGEINQEKVWKIAPDADGKEYSDLKEYFDMGAPSDVRNPTPFPPEAALPGFSDFMISNFSRLQKLCIQLLDHVEIGLGLHPGGMGRRCEPGTSELRLNYYPSSEGSPTPICRTFAHTDLGALTLLFTDDVGGLEFQNQSTGVYERVELTEPGDMLVNVADTLERWTNGVLKAGRHQVLSVKGESGAIMPARRSIAFFLKASLDASAGPLDAFISQGPAKYDNITIEQFLKQKYRKLYQ